MDQGKLTGAAFIDLQKAFDTVEHSVLLSKLPFYGVTGNELMWIESYLSGRFQYVHYDNVKSELQLRAEANGEAGGAERPPSRPFVGKFCSLVGIFVF